ncbi:MAG: glycosyltransferase family 4 protein [Calditrichota bacterium]
MGVLFPPDRLMNIALIIYGSLDTVSGGYLYDRMLVERLRASGHKVDIISLPWRNYVRHLLDNFSNRIYQQILQNSYDVVLQDELNHPSLIRLNTRLKGKFPLISIVHHLRISEGDWFCNPVGYAYRFFERRYLASVDAMLFTSHATQQTVQALQCLPEHRHVAHPAASHLQNTKAKARSITTLPRLLFVGNVIPRKGPLTLLQALYLHVETKWQLTIAGRTDLDEKYTGYLQKYLQIREMDYRVRFTGPVTQEELIRLYESHDVFVMPSQHEGFGIVYLEAMSFGLPVIASSAGGAVDIVQHGKNGFLVNPGHAAQVANVIKQLSDSSVYRKFSEGAIRTYQSHPNWEMSMNGVEQFIKETVAKWRKNEK